MAETRKRYIRGKRFEAEKQRVSNPSGKNQYSEVKPQNDVQPTTSQKIAALTGVSKATIERDAQWVKAVDEIKKDEPGLASKIIAGTVKATQQEVLDLSEKSRAEKKVVAEKVFFGATNLAAKKAEKPNVHVRYADYDENGRFTPLDRMGGKIEVRWVAKCGKVGYTAFEGSLAAQTDFAEHCGAICKGGEPGCWKPADPPKNPHYTVPEGVITSKIEDDGSSKWYWVTTCGDEAKEDYDTTTDAYADLVKHCVDCNERKDDCWKADPVVGVAEAVADAKAKSAADKHRKPSFFEDYAEAEKADFRTDFRYPMIEELFDNGHLTADLEKPWTVYRNKKGHEVFVGWASNSDERMLVTVFDPMGVYQVPGNDPAKWWDRTMKIWEDGDGEAPHRAKKEPTPEEELAKTPSKIIDLKSDDEAALVPYGLMADLEREWVEHPVSGGYALVGWVKKGNNSWLATIFPEEYGFRAVYKVKDNNPALWNSTYNRQFPRPKSLTKDEKK